MNTMTDTDDDTYDPSADESAWRCIDCDSRYHRTCTPTDKETR